MDFLSCANQTNERLTWQKGYCQSDSSVPDHYVSPFLINSIQIDILMTINDKIYMGVQYYSGMLGFNG